MREASDRFDAAPENAEQPLDHHELFALLAKNDGKESLDGEWVIVSSKNRGVHGVLSAQGHKWLFFGVKNQPGSLHVTSFLLNPQEEAALRLSASKSAVLILEGRFGIQPPSAEERRQEENRKMEARKAEREDGARERWKGALIQALAVLGHDEVKRILQSHGVE